MTSKHYSHMPQHRTPIEGAESAIEDYLDQREEHRAVLEEEANSTITDVAELEQQIEDGKMAIAKYRRIMKGTKRKPARDLNLDEERMFLAMQDSLRKLRVSLSALRDKETYDNLSEAEIAVDLVKTGMSKEEVLSLYGRFPGVADALKEMP